MARRKRNSRMLTVLRNRLAGLQSIDEDLDLGGGISVVSISDAYRELRDALNDYNRMLSDIDAALNHIIDLEDKARDLSERALAGVATKYGKDSSQYEQAGGTRKSERKKRGAGGVAKAVAQASQEMKSETG